MLLHLHKKIMPTMYMHACVHMQTIILASYQLLDREGGRGEVRHTKVNLIAFQQLQDGLFGEFLLLLLVFSSLRHCSEINLQSAKCNTPPSKVYRFS